MPITNYLPCGQLNKGQLYIIIPKKCGNWLGSNLTSLRPGDQVANARGRCAPRAFKKVLQPSPLWLGFIVVWINCGLDQLWLGSILAWINYGLDCVKFWLVCHRYIWICSTRHMFNMKLGESNFGQWEFVKLAICAVWFCSIDHLFSKICSIEFVERVIVAVTGHRNLPSLPLTVWREPWQVVF